MTALQNANKENLDSLDVSSLIQFEEPRKKKFNFISTSCHIIHTLTQITILLKVSSKSNTPLLSEGEKIKKYKIGINMPSYQHDCLSSFQISFDNH